MQFGATVSINISALKHNLAKVRENAPKSLVLAMIKSDGYGHGMLLTAKALADADAFGVASLAEALTLRQNGCKKPILIMRGFLSADELELFAQNNLQAVVHDFSQLQILQQTKLAAKIGVWLKIDTGMHRLGFCCDAVKEVYSLLNNNQNVLQPINLMTHLSRADDLTSDYSFQQIAKFNNCIKDLSGEKSVANSAGIIAWQKSHLNWVRPGIMLYGISPFANRVGADFSLKPVMRLSSNLIAVKKIAKGDQVGYGGNWICPRDTLLGIVAIGYGDGYPRHAKNGTPVFVNGVVCPLIGRVSMDMIAVDINDCSQAKTGDEVELWGENLPVEIVAHHADTIPYELLTGLSQRVRVVPVFE